MVTINKPLINAAARILVAAASLGSLVAATAPQAPQAYVDTSMAATPVTGKSITVNAGDDLQAAINQAAPGDEIVLQAGATFTGNYTLPNKGSGAGWVTIRSSQLAALPPSGTRVGPAMANLMPKIAAAGTATAFYLAPGANHYRMIGLEITVAPGTALSYGLIMSGDPSDTNAADLPNEIIWDRDYVHGSALCHCKFGAQMNGTNYAIVDSYFSDFHAVGQDASAIFTYITPGPLKIVNNELEGAAENVLFGGAYDAIPGIVPSDIEVRNNHFYKPLSWMNGIVPAPGGVSAQPVGGGSLSVGTTYYYAVVALGTGDTLYDAGIGAKQQLTGGYFYAGERATERAGELECCDLWRRFGYAAGGWICVNSDDGFPVGEHAELGASGERGVGRRFVVHGQWRVGAGLDGIADPVGGEESVRGEERAAHAGGRQRL